MNRVELIKEKMRQLGYVASEVISVDQLEGFEKRFNKRVAVSPVTEKFYESQKRLVEVKQNFPWAKSILVAYTDFSRYEVPQKLRGRIGKAYLFDARLDPAAPEHTWQLEVESYLSELGILHASYHKFGLVPMRYVAEMAGLGAVRFNNFFYGKNGSYVHLVAWLLDEAALEVVEKTNDEVAPCPENCNRCIAACPTKALDAPYGFHPTKCISFLTTFGGRNLDQDPTSQMFRNCVYGCDICQDVCPKNKHAHEGLDKFPNLEVIAPLLDNENILMMSQEIYLQKIQPKFFYLGEDELWKWQMNVLSAIDRNFRASDVKLLEKALHAMDVRVKPMAEKILQKHAVDSTSRL